jgi:hypothetical protein
VPCDRSRSAVSTTWHGHRPTSSCPTPGRPLRAHQTATVPRPLAQAAIGRACMLAADHGVTALTVGRDWPISQAAEAMRPVIAHSDLVVCRDLLNERNGDQVLMPDRSSTRPAFCMAVTLPQKARWPIGLCFHSDPPGRLCAATTRSLKPARSSPPSIAPTSARSEVQPAGPRGRFRSKCGAMTAATASASDVASGLPTSRVRSISRASPRSVGVGSAVDEMLPHTGGGPDEGLSREGSTLTSREGSTLTS